jgi:uncharacterized protein (TIGR03067 family)
MLFRSNPRLYAPAGVEGSGAPSNPRGLDLLQGPWRVTALKMGGFGMPSLFFAAARLEINGARLTASGLGAEFAGTVELNEATTPRSLALKFDSGPERGNTLAGIYELTGETLHFCLAKRGAAAPTSFTAEDGIGLDVTLARAARG